MVLQDLQRYHQQATRMAGGQLRLVALTVLVEVPALLVEGLHQEDTQATARVQCGLQLLSPSRGDMLARTNLLLHHI